MNKQTTLFTAILAVGSLLLLAGCAKYKALPLQQSITTTQKGISLQHKAFDKQDCQTYLGRKNFLKKGLQPIQITITNNTKHSYAYSASSLSLPIVPAQMVANKVERSTIGRFFGYGLASYISFIPAATAGALFTICPHTLGILAIPSFIAGTGFFVAAIVDPIKSHKANKQLRADFDAKALPNEGFIRPSQTISKIVFVPKNEFKDDFTFTVYDVQTNEATVLTSSQVVMK